MKAICIIPKGTQEGILVWQVNRIYPSELFDEAINQLNVNGFIAQELENNTGISFFSNLPAEEAVHQLRIAYSWIDITFHDQEEDVDVQEALLSYAIVALPLSRLLVEDPIITNQICLFPPNYIFIQDVCKFDGTAFNQNNDSQQIDSLHYKSLRDYITTITGISLDDFHRLPLMVFTMKISYEEYRGLNQAQDVDLIKRCSDRAESVMDLLRFYRSDYNLAEALPARAGLWNGRYSAMYIYFPKYGVGHIQSREVERKTFIKGIGMDFYDTHNITSHPLMDKELNGLQYIIKHALKLNSSIMEAEDDTVKFTQIMMLLEYIGDPNDYGKFQDMKAKFVGTLAKDKNDYNRLSNRFKELTSGINPQTPSQRGLRTQIVHMGKSIYELIPDSEKRKDLFTELYGYIYVLIQDMMFSSFGSWNEYDEERRIRRDTLLSE